MIRVTALARFLCGRKGAAIARALMIIFALVGPAIGGAILWIGSHVVEDYKEQRKTLLTVHQDLRNYVTGATERGTAARARLDRTEREVVDLDRRVDDHERRIYRIEGRP
jgi:TM2 domain-containing membrane protein YozV